MANKDTDPEQALQKLGKRLREGFAKQNPTQEKSLQTVKEAVRDQYEQELKKERSMEREPRTPTKGRESKEPDKDSR